jgi:diaminopropionate ammonia-lyase
MLELNHLPEFGLGLDQADAAAFGAHVPDLVRSCVFPQGADAPTPLVPLPALAAQLGIAGLYIKDEGQRLGLGSFKALGGTHAVIRCMLVEAAARLGRACIAQQVRDPEVSAVAATMTMACATDGNHGLAVAAGAQMVGAQAAIFVHSHVSAARVDALAARGARVIHVAGNYDDAVAEARRACAAEGWTLIADTSWPGYEHTPMLVMQGYTVLVREALDQLPTLPTHWFVQAGVGGLAGAVAAYLSCVLGTHRPTLVIVEPHRAACLYQSAVAGKRVRIAPAAATVMAMLECFEPSLVAWRILCRTAYAFMMVEDADAIAAMRRLARPLSGDTAIVAGESGGAGLAGLVKVAGDPGARAALDLGPDAQVMLINTEGATDPGRYAQLVDAQGDLATDA